MPHITDYINCPNCNRFILVKVNDIPILQYELFKIQHTVDTLWNRRKLRGTFSRAAHLDIGPLQGSSSISFPAYLQYTVYVCFHFHFLLTLRILRLTVRKPADLLMNTNGAIHM